MPFLYLNASSARYRKVEDVNPQRSLYSISYVHRSANSPLACSNVCIKLVWSLASPWNPCHLSYIISVRSLNSINSFFILKSQQATREIFLSLWSRRSLTDHSLVGIKTNPLTNINGRILSTQLLFTPLYTNEI